MVVKFMAIKRPDTPVHDGRRAGRLHEYKNGPDRNRARYVTAALAGLAAAAIIGGAAVAGPQLHRHLQARQSRVAQQAHVSYASWKTGALAYFSARDDQPAGSGYYIVAEPHVVKKGDTPWDLWVQNRKNGSPLAWKEWKPYFRIINGKTGTTVGVLYPGDVVSLPYQVESLEVQAK